MHDRTILENLVSKILTGSLLKHAMWDCMINHAEEEAIWRGACSNHHEFDRHSGN